MVGLGLGVACTACVCLLLYAERRQMLALKWAAKPLASFLFVLIALHSGALESSFGQMILAGLVLSALGDVLLIPRREAFFLAGMGAFGLGHLAFLAAFLMTEPRMTPYVALAGVTIIGVSAVFLKTMWRHLGAFRIPVIIYVTVIAAMVTASAAIGVLPQGAAPAWRFFVAASAFAISDIAVARDQFAEQRFANKLWGLPLYYGAQLLFAYSV